MMDQDVSQQDPSSRVLPERERNPGDGNQNDVNPGDAAEGSPQADAGIRIIAEQLGDGLIIIDHRGSIQVFNGAAEKIFGYDRSEVLGHPLSMLLPRDDQVPHEDYVRESNLHSPRIINHVRDMKARRKDGTPFLMELNVTRLAMPGQPDQFIGIFRDVSERKAMEQRLIAEREAANRALEMAEAANRANQAKSLFIASMSHELRTPLTAILGFSNLMAELDGGSLSADQRDYLGHVIDNGEHLLKLISELLELSSIEAGKTRMEVEPVPLDRIVPPCLDVARLLATKHQVKIHDRRGHRQAPLVLADPIRLSQIMLNLLTNAIKYNLPGGEVHIDDRLIDGNFLRIVVTDTGRGIDPGKIDNLFNSFNRLGAEESDIEGNGIGLYLTHKLVHMMNGTMGVDSEPGKGSTFWFQLPLERETASRTGVTST